MPIRQVYQAKEYILDKRLTELARTLSLVRKGRTPVSTTVQLRHNIQLGYTASVDLVMHRQSGSPALVVCKAESLGGRDSVGAT